MDNPNQQSNAWQNNDDGDYNNTIDYRISSPPQVNNISSTVDPGRPISSQSNHVIQNPNNKNNLVGVQSKFRRRYYHKVLFGSLILLILILVIAIIVLAFKGRNSHILCDSRDCLRSASNLLLSMDETVDPCEDFYQFTCGNWGEEHPRPDSVTSYDWFSEKQAKILRHVRSFLQMNNSEGDPKAVVKTRTMYKACMDEQTLDDLEMEPILKYFKDFKLPLNPKALNVTANSEDFKGDDQKLKFNFINSIAQIKKVLTMDVIIGFDVFSDPLNGTINRIVVGTPESGSPLPFTNKKDHKTYQSKKKNMILSFDSEADEDESEEELAVEGSKISKEKISAYLSYLKNVISMYYAYKDSDLDPDETMKNVTKPLLKYVEISKQFYKFQEMAENISLSSKTPMEDLLFLNLSQLIIQAKTEDNKSIDWTEYLRQMMAENVQNLSISSEIILTSKADIIYLQAVTEYLSTLQIEYIELYIWMTIFEELILHTTRELRSIHHMYMNLIISTEGSTPRSLYCTNGLNNLLGMATSYSLADKSFEMYTLPKVKSMLNDIRTAFNNLVKSTSWMDKKTKYETLEKSNAMKSFIGFPDWVLNKTTLDSYYSNITANETTHLENLVNILRWEMKTKLQSLRLPNEFGWATAPATVNAYHTFQANAISNLIF
ncbi:Nep5 family protein [Megaselia abdita]